MKAQGEGRFLPLLIALSVLFVLYPLVDVLGVTRLFRILFILVLVVAVYTLGERRRQLVIVLALALPSAIGQAVALTHPNAATLKIAVGFALLFVGYVTVVILRGVLKGGKVTGDKIAGAIGAYLLLGLSWAMLYAMIDLFVPGAFEGSIDAAAHDGSTGRDFGFIYYSFVTLTTLGYGDVSPLSPIARTAAWMQAVTGQLYIAILVARLVALQILHGADSSGEA